MKLITLVLCCLVTTSGCYFGRTKSAKTGGYVASGIAVALGTAVIVSGTGNDCPEGSDVSCGVGSGAAAAGAVLVGAVLIAAGGLGLVLNLVIPTKREATPTVTPVPTGGAAVTTPGLPATTIQLQ
jgi:hypothetical protein